MMVLDFRPKFDGMRDDQNGDEDGTLEPQQRLEGGEKYLQLAFNQERYQDQLDECFFNCFDLLLLMPPSICDD